MFLYTVSTNKHVYYPYIAGSYIYIYLFHQTDDIFTWGKVSCSRKQREHLMRLELTTDKHPPITNQTRYPLRHAVSVN